jgi:hypothetical protein
LLAAEPEVLALAFRGIPILPVKVWHDGRWKKEPLVGWDEATTDEPQIERWWRKWPDALPGIPLRKVDWVAIDVDAEDCLQFWDIWNGLGPRGPYSKIQTPSGGWHFLFAQHPQHPISKFQWCDGVEILGSSCLLTVHDIQEVLFPHVAPRAWLPKVFWEPWPSHERDARHDEDPIKNREEVAARKEGTEVADATAAWQLDARDFGNYHDWFALMVGAKFVGISQREFLRWSATDPDYAVDARRNERMWEACDPQHGGGFYAALAVRGIRLGSSGKGVGKHSPVFNRVPDVAGAPAVSQAGPDLRRQSRRLIDWLNQQPTEDRLFYVGCVFAERGMAQDVAFALLKSNCASLRKSLGADQFKRQITRAYAHIKSKEFA